MTYKLSKNTIESLWADFDVPVNDLEEIEADFCGWQRLTDRDDIWHWFDEQYAQWGGVHALMFPDEGKEPISVEQMKKRRERLGLSKSAFARECGMHPSSIGQIELGRLVPYPGQVEKIVSTLDRLEANAR